MRPMRYARRDHGGTTLHLVRRISLHLPQAARSILHLRPSANTRPAHLIPPRPSRRESGEAREIERQVTPLKTRDHCLNPVTWLLLPILCFTVLSSAHSRVYVDKNAPGPTFDGTTWATAFTTIQAGINAASASKDEVWVADGTYVERVTISAQVTLYGGFAGNETLLSQRNPVTNITTIDAENSGRPVSFAGGSSNAVIDGFQIANGNVSGDGGGVWVANSTSPIIRNNRIRNNYASGWGGGIFTGSGTATQVLNNVISSNSSGSWGGGVAFYYAAASSLASNNVVIRNGNGTCAGIAVFQSTATLNGNTFLFNHGAGAIRAWDSPAAKAYNNIIALNTSGFYTNVAAANVDLKNNCFFNNRDWNVAGINDPTGTNGNITADPLLRVDARGIAHIMPGSPCINAGQALGFSGTTDIDGQARIQGADLDIGADESDGSTPGQAVLYVKPTGDDANDGKSWATAKKTLQHAQDSAAAMMYPEIWVASGTYVGSIEVSNGIAMYGGFAGTETLLSQRNPRANITVIDANKAGPVVLARWSVGRGTIVDGFTITNGSYSGDGGGIRIIDAAGPIIRGNVVTGNSATGWGGGIWCGNSSAAWILGNIVQNNSSGSWGGGIAFYYTQASSIAANNVVARNNGGPCGGIAVFQSVVPVINNTIIHNLGDGNLRVWDTSAAKVYNNIIAFNSKGFSTNVNNANIDFKNNNVFWNRQEAYLGYPDQTGINGNIAVDPMLSVDIKGVAHIAAASPCRNTGLNSVVFDTDVDYQARIQGPSVDIGADESDGTNPAQIVVFVKPTGDDAMNGLTWANAKKTVQAGMDAAQPLGAEVWVVKGTYKERITLRNAVAVFGGFLGTESTRAARNPVANVTILDAEQKGWVVLADSNTTRGSVLDGFTVTNGSVSGEGGGVRCTDWAGAVIRNNVITGNYASNWSGGVWLGVNNSSYVLNNIISNNSSGNRGAGVGAYYAYWSRIADNVVMGNSGATGGIDTHQCSPPVVGNTIIHNTGEGSLMLWDYSSANVQNNIVAFNTYGVRCNMTPENVVMKNNLVYGNIVYDFSSASYNKTGTNGNISTDPMFVYDTAGLPRLKAGSPCINTGTNDALIPESRAMQDKARIVGGTVDIGADEYTGVAPVQGIVYVKPGGDDTKNGLSWANAKKSPQAAIDQAVLTSAHVWIAAGTYIGTYQLKRGVMVYGGFAGSETSLNQRNIKGNPTILTSFQNGTVVSSEGNTTRDGGLDGFIVERGYSTGNGGGMNLAGQPIIRNNIVRNCNASNWGGGIFTSEGSGPWILNNVITGCSAGARGAGILAYRTYYGRIAGNVVTQNSGPTSGIDILGGLTPVINNTITNNTGDGALILWDYSGARVFNNIIAGNSAGMRTNVTSYLIAWRNNNVFNNGAYNFSGYADPTGRQGNISVDPKLAYDGQGVPRPNTGSPCIDTGYNTVVIPEDRDLDGKARILNGTVDIGASEYDGTMPPSQGAIFVRPGGNDDRDGLSWANAKKTIQAGINKAAATSAEVWVAIGPYTEQITLKSGVAVYGGFTGVETTRSARDFRANPTIIDGGGTRRCVYADSSAGNSAVLDGFVLQNGFTTEHGGGIRLVSATPVIANCVIRNNKANNSGGGVYAYGGAPQFINVTIVDNNARDTGGIYFQECSNAALISSLLSRNVETVGNAAITVNYGDVLLMNNTVVDNPTCYGLVLANSIGRTFNNIFAWNKYGVWANTYDPWFVGNCVFGNALSDYHGTMYDMTGIDGNIKADPLFVSRAGFDYHLQAASPCRDAGTTAFLPVGALDLDGFARIHGTSVDMGAYELALNLTPAKLVFSTSPGSSRAGQPFPIQPVVTVRTADNRIVTDYTGSVAVAIKAGTGASGAVLSGTVSIPVSNGIASFTNLSIDLRANGYVLRATSGSLTAGESKPFDIMQANPTLVVTTQPATAVSGLVFTTAPVVTLRDIAGVATSFTGPVTVGIKAGTGAILSGTRTVNAVAGVATFADLSIDLIGTGYVLVFTTTDYGSVESAPFEVTPKPSRLAFTVQPGGAVAGQRFLSQPTLTLLDDNGLVATAYNGSGTVAIKSGTGAAGAVLGGTKTITFQQGVGRFNDLLIDKVGMRYILTGTVGPFSTESMKFRVVSTANDLKTRVYTSNDDFDEGVQDLVGHATAGQLALQSVAGQPFIWIPNQNNTVSRVNTITGAELARYYTGPIWANTQPSRTTVDLYGACWVGNRYSGTAVKIVPPESNLWKDRNNNGICDTSTDLNGDGNISSNEMLPWGLDECLVWEVVLIDGKQGVFEPGEYTGTYTNDWGTPGVRTVAVDSANNVWIGCHMAMKFYYVDSLNGVILRTVDVSPVSHHAYGGVIDANGVLWSSGSSYGNALKLDPRVDPPALTNVPPGHYTYGIGVDSLNHVFITGWDSSKMSKLDALTNQVIKTISSPANCRGVCSTADTDVWIASTANGKVYRYDNDLNLKAEIPVGAEATGVAIDPNGKIWSCGLGSENIYRIDPATNTVDLTKQIVGSGGHYSYSDMTGSVSTGITARQGKWTVIHDGGALNTLWGTITWNDTIPQGATLTVRVRSSDDLNTWSAWETVTKGATMATTPPGRFLQIEVTFQIVPGASSPILLDLTVGSLEFSVNDARNALKIAAGLQAATGVDMVRLNVIPSTPERIDLRDVATLVRKLATLDP
jgi:hypothetical protein